MGIALPESIRKLLTDKAYGHVITYNPSGTPQITMVWMDVDGNQVLFNTAEGRKKPRNLRQDPRIIVSVQSKEDPQAYAAFYGKATLTKDGAEAHIDKLAKRYLGQDKYPWRAPGEERVLVRIDVDKIGGYGPGMKPWA